MTLADQVVERLDQAGATVPTFNLVADLLEMAATEAEGWTHWPGDAERIPDVLHEAARACRKAEK